jgi:hypothetical protein
MANIRRGHPRRHSASDEYSTRLAPAVARFGEEVRPRLALMVGSPEDQLRGPFERLLSEAGTALGLDVLMHGETRLTWLAVRPDYAVDVAGARVGYIELKAPGKGTDPSRWPLRSHDRLQWEKLRALPNVLYSDGQEFCLYRSGVRLGRVAHLKGNIVKAGSRLQAADTTFAKVLSSFLLWEPEQPRNTRQLVRSIAGLCRLLRDEVLDALRRQDETQHMAFTSLADDWRGLLFPDLDNKAFADAYAQTVTFALLLARSTGVEFNNTPMSEIARQLGKTHSVMGKALDVMTDGTVERDSVVVESLRKVIGVVDWNSLEDAGPNSYALLYESFLDQYDPELRKSSGSYYTPDDAAQFMVQFVDEILQRRLDRSRGFASPDVLVVDPAMGTGTFLTAIIDKVAETVTAEEGPGQVEPRLRELFRQRLIGFEKQVCPYAVTELRTHQALRQRRADVPATEVRFLTDTLDNPNLQAMHFGRMYEVLQKSRQRANHIKRSVPVMVVIGNPPYLKNAKGHAPWIEDRGDGGRHRPSLDSFRMPGNGRLEYVLSNLYVYFWRWATWKAFDAHPQSPAGVVAFISTSGYIGGPGFAGMRDYLRRTADEGWIINLSPEGHRPDTKTRLFSGVQQPLSIGIFARYGSPQPSTPARIHYTELSGSRSEKLAGLGSLRLADSSWDDCSYQWRDKFVPTPSRGWSEYPELHDILPWCAPGIKSNRTWVYSPDQATLIERWDRLINADPGKKPLLFKESQSANLRKISPPLPGQEARSIPFSEERGSCPEPARVAYRSFDRQWLIPDSRLIHRPSRDLWQVHSDRQVYVTEQHAHPIGNGPGLTFCAEMPDMHHFDARGGRVYPLFRDTVGREGNVAPRLIEFLNHQLDVDASPADLFAYIAGVIAHPGYTKLFTGELASSGIRVPVTREQDLWHEAKKIGEEVIWLHSYGRRYANNRPDGVPTLSGEQRPFVTSIISDRDDEMPESLFYDEVNLTLCVGTGTIAPVSREVWQYEVSGRRIIERWFSYRKKSPNVRRGSPLDDISPSQWSPQYTTELLELINVLGRCVALYPTQENLLGRIVSSQTMTTGDLGFAGILPLLTSARKPPKPSPQDSLF